MAVREAVFKRPAGALVAIMGVLILLATAVGLVLVVATGAFFDLKTAVLVTLGVAGAGALGVAFINAWRTPMLTVRPDALIVPTVFGAREIRTGPGHPVGEFLAVSDRGSGRVGTIEANKFVHFYTLDGSGRLVELAAMHRDAPEIPAIRRALVEVGGLRVETLRADPKSRLSRPDVGHWLG